MINGFQQLNFFFFLPGLCHSWWILSFQLTTANSVCINGLQQDVFSKDIWVFKSHEQDDANYKNQPLVYNMWWRTDCSLQWAQ